MRTLVQVRDHVLESGPVENSASAEGTSGGEYERGPSRKGDSGGSPLEKFDLCVPLSAFFIHFGCVLGQNFSCFSWDIWPE